MIFTFKIEICILHNIDSKKEFVTKSLFANNILAFSLVAVYCVVYGVSAQVVMKGLELMFFISSLIFALTSMYIRDPEVQKAKFKKGIIYNQAVGTALVITYMLVFGVSSIALYSGFELIFFMTSYVFVLSYFYLRDPKRLEKFEEIASSSSSAPYHEKYPCFINSQDLSWLVRELNDSLTPIIGFTELILKKPYSDCEREFMLRNIYERALSMHNSISKVATTIKDVPTKPKEIYEVVDLLDDKNFK